MGTKREADGDWEVDWHNLPRRPFRRVFRPYDEKAVKAAGGLERVKARRNSLGIRSIEDPAGEEATLPPLAPNSDLDLKEVPAWLKEVLQKKLKSLRPVQAQLLPILLAGLNAIAVVPSSPGEEALMYLLLAAMQACDQHALTEEEPGPIALVLADSQEACTSITSTAQKLFQRSGKDSLLVANLSGGGSRAEKLREMSDQGAHVVVATPKRLHDLASKYQVSCLRVTLLVVDGIDRMEAEALQQLGDWIRPERHTVLLSRSWSPQLRELSAELCLKGGLPVKVEMRC